MWDKLSFKVKLLTLCGSLLGIAIIIGGVSYWGINSIDKNMNAIVSEKFPQVKATSNMYLYFLQIRINLRSLGLAGLADEEGKKYVQNVEDYIAKFELERAKMNAFKMSDNEKMLLAEIDKEWAEFKGIGGEALKLYASHSPDSQEKMMTIFLVDCPRLASLFEKTISNLTDYYNQATINLVETSEKEGDLAKKLQMVIMFSGVFAGLFMAYLFAIKISKVLMSFSQHLEGGSLKIDNITSELNKASHSLSASVTQQASALQQTSAAIEQTSASVVSNEENAKKSMLISNESRKSVDNGKRAVDEVIFSIEEIAHSNQEIKAEIEQTNKEIESIVTIINEIGNKTKVINEIVFQTKLLSFNASVEAARAGEHGKGFTVVAEEVGNLAAMSGSSAQEIAVLLESSISKVEETVKKSKERITRLMDVSYSKVNQGTMVAQKCNDALNEIISSVSNVDSMISEISMASSEQSKSVREISSAMNEIDRASHVNSATSKEAQRSATQLEEQIKEFHAMVVDLNEMVVGKKSA